MDSYVLTGPNGSTLNIGSYLLADPGPDFGAKDLLSAVYAESAVSEGGALAYETVGVRHFSFPLRLASWGAFDHGLTGMESYLRALARPGAYIDLLPEGVATSDAVRFDILTGRYEESYSVPLQRIRRRDGTLKLDVPPYGYAPTMILLASAASVGLPGQLAIPNGSLIGDVPGLAEIVIAPTTGTSYAAGSWLTDMIGWSLAGQPSQTAFFAGGSLSPGPGITGTVVGDKYAVGSQALRVFPLIGWNWLAQYPIGMDLEPAYRGRFHAWAHVRLAPSQLPWEFTFDAANAYLDRSALASAGRIASAPPPVASGTPGAYGAQPSPGYAILDLGLVTLPQAASGMLQSTNLRLWGKPGTTLASQYAEIGGVVLQPVDGPAGVLARGLMQATSTFPSVGRFQLDATTKRVLAGLPTGNIGSLLPYADVQHFHYGDLPRVAGSTVRLDLIGGMRSAATGATGPLAKQAPMFAAVSVRYRPRFSFLKAV